MLVLDVLLCDNFCHIFSATPQVTSSKGVGTLICHTIMRRNSINLLYNPGHMTLRYLEVVPVYARVTQCNIDCLLFTGSPCYSVSYYYSISNMTLLYSYSLCDFSCDMTLLYSYSLCDFSCDMTLLYSYSLCDFSCER